LIAAAVPHPRRGFGEALEALAEAETLASGSEAGDEFDLAVAWSIRAVIYMKSGRLDEAISVARAATEVFRTYGDEPREAAMTIVEAASLMFAGDAERGAGAFERVIEVAKKRGDATLLARGLSGAATAYVSLARPTGP